jgi:hypothetical protein
MVEYTVKPEAVAENVALIEAVFAELREKLPAGLRYASFKLEDGKSFVHIASIETDDGANPLQALEAFKAFTSKIKERCAVPPTTRVLEEVGSYRFSAKDDAPSR